MYCKNCGKEISDQAIVCPHCGIQTAELRKENQSNTLALIGFIMAFIVPIAGLICSIMGYKNAPERDGSGKGLATAGIVISAVFLALSVVLIVIYVVLIFGLIGAAAGGVPI